MNATNETVNVISKRNLDVARLAAFVSRWKGAILTAATEANISKILQRLRAVRLGSLHQAQRIIYSASDRCSIGGILCISAMVPLPPEGHLFFGMKRGNNYYPSYPYIIGPTRQDHDL